MPQALYIYVQSGRISLYQAWRISFFVGGMGLGTGALVMLWSMGTCPVLLVVVGATVVAGCLHAQWRALTLIAPQTMLFNLVTVVPQILLLPLAAWVVISDQTSLLAISIAMFFLWMTGALSAALVVARLTVETHIRTVVPLRNLFTHGLSTGLTAVFAILATVLLQKAAQQSVGSAGLGLISMALLIAQIPLTPLNYALPLLLRNRMAQSRTPNRHSKVVLISIISLLMLAGAVWLVGNIRSDMWLGKAYSGLHVLLTILMIASAVEVAIRFGGIEAQATLKPWKIAVAETMRICTLMVLWYATSNEKSPHTLTQLATGWLMASVVALLTLGVCNILSKPNVTSDDSASLIP